MMRSLSDAELVNVLATAPDTICISAQERLGVEVHGYYIPLPPLVKLGGYSTNEIANEVAALIEQKDQLKSQRDQLLGALMPFARAHQTWNGICETTQFGVEVTAGRFAYAAEMIAKVKGGAA